MEDELIILIIVLLIIIGCLCYFKNDIKKTIDNNLQSGLLDSLYSGNKQQIVNERQLKSFEDNSNFKKIDKDTEPYFTTNIEEDLKDLESREIKLNDNIENDNEKIIKFNNNYFNMFDRINNTTSNYNNSVDIINDLKHNDYKIKSGLSVFEFYNKINSP